MADSELLRATYKTRAQARKIRESAKEGRERAHALIARARRLCNRVDGLDRLATKAKNNKDGIRRHPKGQDDVLEALKSSLRDLDSLKMVPSDDPSLQKLKADIRETIARSEGSDEGP